MAARGTGDEMTIGFEVFKQASKQQSEDNLWHFISPVIADELRISPDADVECVLTVRCRTVAALARRVLRVSASSRRVAAAYGSASQCF